MHFNNSNSPFEVDFLSNSVAQNIFNFVWFLTGNEGENVANMNLEEYRSQANKLVDFICEYRKTYKDRRVTPGDEITKNFLIKIMTGTI